MTKLTLEKAINVVVILGIIVTGVHSTLVRIKESQAYSKLNDYSCGPEDKRLG